MTIKRQWMILLTVSALLSIAVNTVILGSLINRYFVGYKAESYARNYDQAVEYSRAALVEGNYSKQQISNQFEAYLDDPIVRIKLYDAEGQLISEAGSESGFIYDIMKSSMMYGMMRSVSEALSVETDSVAITVGDKDNGNDNDNDNGSILGTLNITRYSSVGNSLETVMFKAALVGNSLLSFGIGLIFIIVIGSIVSNKMGRDLKNTSLMALNMDLGNNADIRRSGIREIRIIQQSLEALQTRLKLKQTGRKKLIDELVHQIRTPLTILKTHLEGLEDGLITMSADEIKTCETQVDNISAIINNMNGVIDAVKETGIIKAEEFELNQLIRQIVGGFKAQFDKKKIELAFAGRQKVYLKTDKYKLSQSIYNILTNAYKFTGPGGKVTVEYETEGTDVAISIEDTGIGIGDEDKKHLFEAYYRGRNVGGLQGEGMGLYIANENIRQIGGRINIESTPGRGSRFTVRIPIRYQ